MLELDPYFRTAGSPVATSEGPDSQRPSALLKTARWHAGLSQADVAHRAQTSQQAVARYEKGVHEPSVQLLRRLLAACGMRLDLALSPEPGLVDAPIRELLARPALERLSEVLRQVLADAVPALASLGLPALVGDKAAARLRGAPVLVQHVEFWVDPYSVDAPSLQHALEDLGLSLWSVDVLPVFPPEVRSRFVLLDGALHRTELRVRGVRQFDGHLSRAGAVEAPFGRLLVASAADAALSWPPRDRDRLALQRATALHAELEGPLQL